VLGGTDPGRLQRNVELRNKPQGGLGLLDHGDLQTYGHWRSHRDFEHQRRGGHAQIVQLSRTGKEEADSAKRRSPHPIRRGIGHVDQKANFTAACLLADGAGARSGDSRSGFSRSRCYVGREFRPLPRCPMLPANFGGHTCCPYAFAPIPAAESNSDIPFRIASIPAPSPQMNLA
jgi:hypothetical protein